MNQNNEKQLIKLDALRGLAALYVYLHHTLPPVYIISGVNVGIAFRFGQEAVLLFFMISGFVINYSFKQSGNLTFKAYFYKRLLRIYIPLVPALLIAYLVQSHNNGAWINPELPNLLGNLMMLQDWSFARPNVIVDTYMRNVPLWSLSYEWWFYMMYFPLVTLKCSTAFRDKSVLLLCLFAAVIYTIWPAFPVRIVMYMAIWWIGVMLSDLYMEDRLEEWRLLIMPVGCLVIICGILGVNALLRSQDGAEILFGIYPFIEFRHFLFPVIATVSALIWHHCNWFGFDMIIRPFAIFAPISYTLYIVHGSLAHNGQFLGFMNNHYFEWVGYFVITVAVSCLIELVMYPRIRRRLYPVLSPR